MRFAMRFRDSWMIRIERPGWAKPGVGPSRPISTGTGWQPIFTGSDTNWVGRSTGRSYRMIETTAVPSTGAEYDTHYRAWLERQGPRALDLDWRLRHLLWRQRVLLRRYRPDGKRVLDFGCMDGVFTIRVQQLGGEAVGYDLSPAAIAQAEKFRGSE